VSLVIIQARLNSTRLPGKMLLPIGGKPLIRWAVDVATKFFGGDYYDHVVVACPLADAKAIQATCRGEDVFGWDGPESDVLGRFMACASQSQYQPFLPDIIRITPDDFPIDVTREYFTFAQLKHWHATVTDPHLREHIGLLIPQRIEINTQADYEEARKRVEGQ
jgi:hypothetical protein